MNFRPGWKLSTARGTEILFRLHDKFQRGWNINLRAKYKTVPKESQENQNVQAPSSARGAILFRLHVHGTISVWDLSACFSILSGFVSEARLKLQLDYWSDYMENFSLGLNFSHFVHPTLLFILGFLSDFLANLPRLKILIWVELFSMNFGLRFQPGWNSRCNQALIALKFQPRLKFTM